MRSPSIIWRMNSKWTSSVFFLLALFNGCQQIKALHLTDISVPEVADVRDTVTLSCSYNMGSHKLNSVKWYKDDSEFFRYAPMNYPTIMKFPVVGVTLANDQKFICTKETCSVELDQLEQRTSGSYRCEISGDAPEFKLISKTANMTIAALPRHDPIISGLSHSYENGDFLIANCTSDMSSPPATLFWYINDEKAAFEYLQPHRETTIESDGFQLRFRNLELRFYVDKARHAISRNTMRLRCLAKIDQIPAATRETSVAIFITSPDDVNNQKLMNYWRNSAHSLSIYYKNFYQAIYLLLSIFLSITLR